MDSVWCIDPALLHRPGGPAVQLTEADSLWQDICAVTAAHRDAALRLGGGKRELQNAASGHSYQMQAAGPFSSSSGSSPVPSLDSACSSTLAASSSSVPTSDIGSPMSLQARPSDIKNVSVSSTDDMLWQAVLGRDPNFVGVVWYGVLSTKIYCRPTCPSRRPVRRSNILFYASCSAAEEAGYRACRRCMPRDAQDPTLDRRAKVVAAIKDIIEQAVRSGTTAPSLPLLAEQVGISQFHLHRVFKQSTGMSPKAYEAHVRAKKSV